MRKIHFNYRSHPSFLWCFVTEQMLKINMTHDLNLFTCQGKYCLASVFSCLRGLILNCSVLGQKDQEVRLMKGQRRQAAAGWAEDVPAGMPCRLLFQEKKPTQETWEGNKLACTDTYLCTHWLYTSFSLNRGMNQKFASINAKTEQAHAYKDFSGRPATHWTRAHAHTHITYANKLQRLHGMWQMPSSPAHILFPDQTRPRLLTQGSSSSTWEKWLWNIKFKKKSLWSLLLCQISFSWCMFLCMFLAVQT